MQFLLIPVGCCCWFCLLGDIKNKVLIKRGVISEQWGKFITMKLLTKALNSVLLGDIY